MKCPNCSNEIVGNIKFCGKCGHPLNMAEDLSDNSSFIFDTSDSRFGEAAAENSNAMSDIFSDTSDSEFSGQRQQPDTRSKREKIPKSSKKVSVLYIIILIVAVISGSVLGFFAAKAKVAKDPITPLSTKDDSFHWNTPDEKIEESWEAVIIEEGIEEEAE